MSNHWSVIRIQNTLIAVVLSAAAVVCSAGDLSGVQELVAENRYSEALVEINKLIAADPDNPEILFVKAIALERSGNNTAAVTIYEQLTKSHPNYPEPYNNLAKHYAERGDYELAIRTLEKAFESNKSYLVTYQNLTAIYEKLASEAYRKALNSEAPPISLELAALETISQPAAVTGERIVVAAVETAEVDTGESADAGTGAANNSVELVSLEPVATDEDTAVKPDTSLNQASPDQDSVSVEDESASQAPYLPEEPNPESNGQDRRIEVAQRVLSWANAWATQDIELYLSHYSAEFLPTQGLPLDDWKEQRRVRLLFREFIVVKLSDLDINVDGDTASAQFLQYYKSNVYEGSGTKTLKLSEVKGEWYIVQELI